MYNCFKPEDWKRFSTLAITDLGILLRIRQKNTAAMGGEVVAQISVAATTGDITFEQGASVAAAATTTGNNPQVGATPGVIDLSAVSPLTYQGLIAAINKTTDWEAWLVGALPDDSPEVSVGVGDLMTSTDVLCSTDAGGIVANDISQSLMEVAGLTFNGASIVPHNHDGNVLHELLEVKGTFTYTGAATLKVFACNDVAGTSTEILNIVAAASTVEKAYPGDAGRGEPIISAKARRIVVKAAAATTLTASSLYINGRSYAFGPGPRKSKLESAY
jgi:hypothetical protein